MKYTTSLMLALLLATSCHPDPNLSITVDLSRRGADVRSSMYGIFIEDINRAGDGGLYAEMVLNRSFEDQVIPNGYTVTGDTLVSPLTYNHVTGQQVTVNNRWTKETISGWKLVCYDSAAVTMAIDDKAPFFPTAPHYLTLNVSQPVDSLVLVNSGYGGYGIQEGQKYHFRIIAKTEKDWQSAGLEIRIMGSDGTVLVSKPLILASTKAMVNGWQDIRFDLTSQKTDGDARLQIIARDVKGGTLSLDYVSMMPDDTYHHRPNGMRRDVAETIEQLHPAFVRWPGGCVVEGITLETRFKWKEALGDPASRPGIYNLWGYHNSCGIGWPEMLQFCEDLGAKAMYVCNVGMACQAQTSELLPMSQIDSYVQDCLDAIEYAIGDTMTVWGARRAQDGHPAPYPLQYVELGNENWGAAYDERYNLFYHTIKAKYPQLTLISNYGIDGTKGADEVEMIDPHWYVAPQFFYNNTALFDKLECKKGDQSYGIYVGEYACNRSVGSGNMDGALAEAAFLTGAERNSDRVWMMSYAPLLESNWYRAWPTNLIWVSPTQVMPRSSYYVQQMMAENRPAYNIYSSVTASEPESKIYPVGQIGLGCWKSEVDFRNAVLTLPDGTSRPVDLSAGKQYVGQWNTDDEGTLHQTSITPRCKYMLNDLPGDNYDLQLEARKVAGKDAFIVYFGMDAEAQEGYYWSVGGQNNSKACVEQMHCGENSGQDGDITDFHAEMNQWYTLRIEVRQDTSRLYVDGKLLLQHVPQTHAQHAYTAGYDDEAGVVILKAVNASAEPDVTEYNIEGLPQGSHVAPEVQVITLQASSLQDENSFAEPDLIKPVRSKFQIRDNSFIYTIPPYSFVILRVKIQH